MSSSYVTIVEESQRELQRIVARGRDYRATNDAVRRWVEEGDSRRAVALWLARSEAESRGRTEFLQLTLAAWTHLNHEDLAEIVLLHDRELGDFRQEVDALLKRGHSRVSGMLAAFSRAEPEDWPRLIEYAAAMVSAYPYYRDDLDPILGVLTDLFEAKDSAIRLEVLRALPSKGGPDYVDATLGGLLRDPVAEVRIAAAHSLGRRRSQQAVEPLAGCLTVDETRIARVAAWSLGEIGCSSAVEALYRSVHRRPNLRHEIALALVVAGNLEAIPLLVRCWLAKTVEVAPARGRTKRASPKIAKTTLLAVEELARRVLLEHEPSEVDQLLDGQEPDVVAVVRRLVPAWAPKTRHSRVRPALSPQFQRLQSAMTRRYEEIVEAAQAANSASEAKRSYLGRGVLSDTQRKRLDRVFLPRDLICRESDNLFLDHARSCFNCGRPPEHLRRVWYSTPRETWEHLCGRAGWMTLCDDCRYQVSFFMTMMN